MTATKKTTDLRPGDRVQLHNGLIRTVSHVLPTNYLNRNDEPIFAVYYQEGDTRTREGGWSSANTSHASGLWHVVNEPGCLTPGTVTDYGTIEDVTLTAYRMTDGSFVAFQKVHGKPAPVSPLVVF